MQYNNNEKKDSIKSDTGQASDEASNLKPPVDSNTFSEIIHRLVMGQGESVTALSSSSPTTASANVNGTMSAGGSDSANSYAKQLDHNKIATPSSESVSTATTTIKPSTDNNITLVSERSEASRITAILLSSQPQQQLVSKRSCRAPLSRKFAHPCNCGQSNSHHKLFTSSSTNENNTGNSNSTLSQAALSSPLYLYDSISKKCLPTSRNRDMLLRECHTITGLPGKRHVGSASCVYDDLVCDQRRYRCVCKPSLHLYYKSNQTAFGCIPIGPPSANCRSGYIYNKISKECQKIFDPNDLPPSYPTGVSATQFSFVTIVLIWILLLILIVTAKLRKLRTSNLYRNSPSGERRLHHGNSYGHHGQTTSAWLQPFLAAVNGHHHLNQHRTTVDRHLQGIDESGGNYNDTDFFLNNQRTLNEILQENNFTGSHQSLNNPPPKFEEIYPTSCPNGRASAEQVLQQPPSIEDLPSYDEAMKLRDTIPPDIKE